MNLYDKLLTLQVLDHAWTEWELYRSQLTQYIMEHTPHQGSIALFGAGRCHDIDLRRLAAQYDRIVLLDKDEEAMQAAISHYGLEGSPRIKTEVVDFVGITSEAYRRYADALVMEVRKLGMGTNVNDLARFARAQLEGIYQEASKVTIDFGTKCYENAVVVGVHSQLISMLEWIWSLILQTIGQYEDSVRDRIGQMNAEWTQRFNSAVLAATEHMVIVGCEMQRIGREGAIQGALQGMEDLNAREASAEIEILDQTQMNWPFDQRQSIVYRMQIQQIRFL